MYFAIISKPDFETILNLLLEFEEIHPTEYHNIFSISLRDIRKLKLRSLNEPVLKIFLSAFLDILYDKTKIRIYGEEIPFVSSWSCSGTSGTSGPSNLTYTKKEETYIPIDFKILYNYLFMINRKIRYVEELRI